MWSAEVIFDRVWRCGWSESQHERLALLWWPDAQGALQCEQWAGFYFSGGGSYAKFVKFMR